MTPHDRMSERSKCRPNRDATLTTSPRTAPYADITSNPHEIHPMPRLPPASPLTRQVGQTTYQPAERLTGLVVAAALAASIALVFTGCSTPVLKPSLDVPATFAASTASEMEPEAAWWESFHDPVLSRPGAPRRAREPRRQDRRRAPARGAIRRDGEPFLPGAERQRGRLGQRPQQRLRRRGEAAAAGHPHRQRRPRRLVGGRPERAPARRRGRSGRRRAGRGARRARRAPAGDDRCRHQLLHAGRRAAPARHPARDLRRPGRDPAPGAGAPSGRPGDAVRRRARADRRRVGARADPAAGDDRGGLAAPHRGADRRPGLPCREHRALARRRWPSPTSSPDSPPRCCSAGPTCWR